jgi:hypothetical protein
MLFKETVTVSSKSHVKCVNAMCGKNAESSGVKLNSTYN